MFSTYCCSLDSDETTEPTSQVPDLELDSGSKTFEHLGLLVTRADFDRIGIKVDAAEEASFSGWEKLIATPSHLVSAYSHYVIRKGPDVPSNWPRNITGPKVEEAIMVPTVVGTIRLDLAHCFIIQENKFV